MMSGHCVCDYRYEFYW